MNVSLEKNEEEALPEQCQFVYCSINHPRSCQSLILFNQAQEADFIFNLSKGVESTFSLF